jgi:O-antigen/teichoic acid export membrane protein
MFADNGLQISAVTEICSVRDRSPQVVGELYLAKAMLSALVLALIFAIGLHGHFPRIYWVVGILVTLRTFIQSYSQLQVAILKSLFKMHLVGIVQSLHAGLLLLGIGIAFVRHWPVSAFLALLVAGQTLELSLVSAAVLHNRVRARWPRLSSCFALMRRSIPFGLAYALANLIVRLDVLVLSVLVSLSEIGQFSAADNLLVIVYLASWLFGSVLLPEMVQLSESAERLARFMKEWIRITLLVVVPAALICFLVAPKVIVALYGTDFVHAGTLASWMVLACPSIVLNSLFLHYAIATGAKRTYLGILFVTALFAVVLNYFLARSFGAAGVAAAILIRESLISFAFWLRHSRAGGTAVELGVSVPS